MRSGKIKPNIDEIMQNVAKFRKVTTNGRKKLRNNAKFCKIIRSGKIKPNLEKTNAKYCKISLSDLRRYITPMAPCEKKPPSRKKRHKQKPLSRNIAEFRKWVRNSWK